MKRKLVYDFPTQIFHWSFALLFIIAFSIAKLIDDNSPRYSFHMLAGILLNFTLFIRIIWGFIGSQHARFCDFSLRPSSLVQYFKTLLAPAHKKWTGHNPASSWAAILMMICAVGLGTTGYLMTATPNKETYEEFHEIFANGFFVLAVSHIAGVLLHSLRNRDGIGLSMIDGKKNDVSDQETIASSYWKTGILMIALMSAFSFYLCKNYDRQNKTLQLFGNTLQLGEAGERENESE